MSVPRAVLPGLTVMVSRRTTRRHFLFRPDESRACQLGFLYILAVVAKELGVLVHAVVLMSDHLHAIVTDTRGVLPDFHREHHRLFANFTKVLRGWSEEVFNKSQTSVVELLTPDVLVQKLAYVIANPVACGAVRYSDEWPGVTVSANDIGRRVFRIERPKHYFDPDNPRWPDVVELPIVMPEALVRDRGEEQARRDIALAVERHEAEAHAEARKENKTFLGARRVMSVPIHARGSEYEEFGARNPSFAAGRDTPAAFEAVRQRRTFRSDHRDALERWRQGDRTVVLYGGRSAPYWLAPAGFRAPPSEPGVHLSLCTGLSIDADAE